MRPVTILCCCIAIPSLHAQDPARIWGMTPAGGANNKGTVFAVDADGTDFTTVFDFTDASGWAPEGGLCLAPNGPIYGMTTLGGDGSPAAGTLFTIDPATGIFTKLRDFNGSNGGYNWGTLIVGTDGLLYGAGYGGTGSGGSIFSVDPATNNYTERYALTQATDGGGVNSRLLQAADGMLYGAASQGGANGQAGTLFRFDPNTNAFNKLHDFDGAAGGRTPYGGLCEGGNGWLYGTTFEGGTNNHGIMYKYHPGNNVFQKIHDFDAEGGSNCWSTLLPIGPDLLLGTVASGGSNSAGYLFTIAPSTDAFAPAHSFSLLEGSAPMGSLVAGPDGNFYGMLSFGGTGFYGTVYRVAPGTYSTTMLHHFTNGADGGTPRGEVVLAGSGVGMHEQPTGPAFHMLPNPCAGEVTLRCQAVQLPAQLCLTDALGRTLRTLSITTTTTRLDMNGLRGLVLATFGTAHGTWTQRLVVE